MSKSQIDEATEAAEKPSSIADHKATSVVSSKETELTNDGVYAADEYLDPPPDGGYGWVCCSMVALSNVSTWGANSAYGVFLSYYLSSDYFPDASTTDFALIGGLVVCLTLALVPFASILLVKIGYKPTLSIGILLQLVGFIGASFATKIWHLYLTQSVCIGTAYGIIYGANSIVLPSWFLHKRALVNGISHSGIGLGGIIFCLSVNKLIQQTGDQKWALRMLAIVTFVLSTISMLLIKVRVRKQQFKDELPIVTPTPTIKQIMSKTFDYQVWKMYPLQLATAWAAFTALGFVILLYSLSNYAITIGLTNQQGTIITTVLNVGQTIGRPGIGFMSERYGRTNFTIFGSIYSGFMVFAFWFQCNTYATLLGYAFCAGLFIGIGSVNVVPLVADVVGINSYAAGLSFANIFAGTFSLIAEVIALNLRDYSLKKPYIRCQIFVGCMYFLGMLFLLPYREWKVRRILSHKSDTNKEILRNDWKSYTQRMFYPIKT